jgi:hypothetical protein
MSGSREAYAFSSQSKLNGPLQHLLDNHNNSQTLEHSSLVTWTLEWSIYNLIMQAKFLKQLGS